MKRELTRRELLAGVGAGVGALLASPAWSAAATAPTARVAVARCMTYGPELGPHHGQDVRSTGCLDRLVKGKRSREDQPHRRALAALGAPGWRTRSGPIRA